MKAAGASARATRAMRSAVRKRSGRTHADALGIAAMRPYTTRGYMRRSAQSGDHSDGGEFLLRERGSHRRSLRRSIAAASAAALVLVGAAGAWAEQTESLTWNTVMIAPQTLAVGAATGYTFRGAVSCPSESLCVAAADGAYMATHDPRGSGETWTVTPAAGSRIVSMSCPTEDLCVASGGNEITASDNPGAAQSVWTRQLSAAEGVVSCASNALCLVANTYDGNVWVSTNPTGGASAWRSVLIDPVNGLIGIACPSAYLCVAIDDVGNVVTSTTPTGDASSWHGRKVSPVGFTAVSCPTARFCLALDTDGSTFGSNDPANGASWHPISSTGLSLPHGMTCAADFRCLAHSSTDLRMSDDADEVAASWPGGEIGKGMFGISCPSVTLCVIVDLYGHAVVGTGPQPMGIVNVAVNGPGEGTISGAGLACPPACSASNVRGSQATLSAQPAAGSTFAGWGGACSGAGECTVEVLPGDERLGDVRAGSR